MGMIPSLEIDLRSLVELQTLESVSLMQASCVLISWMLISLDPAGALTPARKSFWLKVRRADLAYPVMFISPTELNVPEKVVLLPLLTPIELRCLNLLPPWIALTNF
jgi:hypothetical protein